MLRIHHKLKMCFFVPEVQLVPVLSKPFYKHRERMLQHLLPAYNLRVGHIVESFLPHILVPVCVWGAVGAQSRLLQLLAARGKPLHPSKPMSSPEGGNDSSS